MKRFSPFFSWLTALLVLASPVAFAQAETAPPPGASAQPPEAAVPSTAPANASDASLPAPAAPVAPPAPGAPQLPPAETPPAAAAETAAPSTTPAVEATQPPAPPRRNRSGERVIFTRGSTAHLPAGETAEFVGALFGAAHVEGDVRDAVFTLFGPATVTGSVGDSVVSVFGPVRVDGPVRGSVVSVFGSIELGANARVRGSLVAVGGSVKRHPQSEVREETVELGGKGFPEFVGLRAWFTECFLKLRPLAFHPDLGWAWGLAGAFLAFYLFIALVLNRGLTRCAETLEERPGQTILAAFLTVFIAPLLLVVLAITLVGPPVLLFALIVASLFGKAAFLTWLGRRIMRPLGVNHAAPAIAVGGVILLGLYVVPYLGFLMMKLTDVLGVGMIVYTLSLSMRREKRAATDAATASVAAASAANASRFTSSAPSTAWTGGPAAATTAPTPGAGAPPPMSSGFTASPESLSAPFVVPPTPTPPPVAAAAVLPGVATGESVPQPMPGEARPPRLSSAMPTMGSVALTASLPRAGFWIRLAASLLDVILVSVSAGILNLSEYTPALFAAYCGAFWAWRGTTIGGVVCGLKIVRLDDRPVDWPVAVIRVLGGFLSFIAAGLGFIWVIFDDDRQSWHDKIAGTVIVHAPKGVSLI